MAMKILFYKILTIFFSSLLAIEACSFLATLALKNRILTSNPEDYTLSSKEIESLKNIYDSKLGWDFKEATKFGERKRAKDYGVDGTITFGDSFTRGDDVADECSWQEYLSSHLKHNVFNFGVGGFGVDQAFLKYQLKKKSFPKVKNVILAFIPGDINRNMNVYRKLIHTFEGGVELTKPYFTLSSENKIILNENPIGSVEDLSQLQDSDFIRSLMAKDWWHQNHSFPNPQFPYFRTFLDKNYLSQLREPLDYEPWFSREGFIILSEILTNFSNEVKLSGAHPLIVFLPDYYFIKGYFEKDPRRMQTEKIFLQICKDRSLNCQSAVSLFSHKGDREKFFKAEEESSHYSCEGNKTVAQFLQNFLKR